MESCSSAPAAATSPARRWALGRALQAGYTEAVMLAKRISFLILLTCFLPALAAVSPSQQADEQAKRRAYAIEHLEKLAFGGDLLVYRLAAVEMRNHLVTCSNNPEGHSSYITASITYRGEMAAIACFIDVGDEVPRTIQVRNSDLEVTEIQVPEAVLEEWKQARNITSVMIFDVRVERNILLGERFTQRPVYVRVATNDENAPWHIAMGPSNARTTD
jgi:hypothetical protein